MAEAHVAASPSQAGAQSALVDEAERAATSISGRLAAREVDVHAADAPPSLPPAGDGARESVATPKEASARVESEPPRVAGGIAPPAGRVRQRAAAVGASVGDSLRPRVGKLRERSVVVFDEAADDPGLRFVLVAAVLVIIALLLFIFSFALR
jgi:hypothetical protein